MGLAPQGVGGLDCPSQGAGPDAQAVRQLEVLVEQIRQGVSVLLAARGKVRVSADQLLLVEDALAMTSEEEAAIEELLANTVRIVPVTSSIARMAGDLRRLYARLKPFDSAIAATAIFAHTKLVTRNVRDFEQIDELDILAI